MKQTHTPIVEAFDLAVGTELTLKGWVRTRRDSKAGLSFIALHDGSCHDAMQVVAPADLSNYEDVVQKLTTGCAIAATGTLVESQGKGQSVELQATGIVEDPDTYPVPMKRHTMEYLREQAHLRVRTNTFGAVARVRHCLAMGVHRFFDERGFYYIHTPIITGSDCEGAGEMFRVSTLDRDQLPRGPRTGRTRLRPGLLRSRGEPHRLGQLNVETYCWR
jgi:asparaginyl-tRNA synthetase